MLTFVAFLLAAASPIPESAIAFEAVCLAHIDHKDRVKLASELGWQPAEKSEQDALLEYLEADAQWQPDAKQVHAMLATRQSKSGLLSLKDFRIEYGSNQFLDFCEISAVNEKTALALKEFVSLAQPTGELTELYAVRGGFGWSWEQAKDHSLIYRFEPSSKGKNSPLQGAIYSISRFRPEN